MGFRSFEEIEAWQRARQLANEIYDLSDRRPWSRDFALKDQIREAAISVMSNIAEGFERDGNAEFAHFLDVSKASAGEVRSDLYLALDREYISPEEFARVFNLASETSKKIRSLSAYLRSSDFKGLKYKTPDEVREALATYEALEP